MGLVEIRHPDVAATTLVPDHAFDELWQHKGWTVVPEPVPVDDSFDPAEHTVPEVNEHLATADDDEQDRVLSAESAGKARTGILGEGK